MRTTITILAGSMLLAACGGAPEKKAEAKADTKTLAAGEYQIDREVTALTDPSNGSGAKLGATSSAKACIAGDGKPDVALYVPAGDTCTAETEFVRSGRIASSYKCKRAGKGEYGANVDGTIADGGFEAEVNIASYFGNGKDYRLTERLKGKRIGDCPKA